MDQDRPALTTYQSLASRIEMPLLRMEMSEDEVRDGCSVAAGYAIGAVVVRPSDLDIAIRALRGTGVRVTSVVGFPHGSPLTATKLYEARDLIRRGAKGLNAVINTGKLISRQFSYLETELVQLVGTCRPEGVPLNVVLILPPLQLDHRVIGCRLAKRVEADCLFTTPATADQVQFFYERAKGRIRLKAGGSIATLEHARSLYEAGADLIETAAVPAILDAWKEHLREHPTTEQTSAPAVP
jgi:deoxyribose-phosphate aldolase